jgi:hypothetical protein
MMSESSEITSPEIYCLECRYPLDGIVSNRCPECGRVFDLTDSETFRRALADPASCHVTTLGEAYMLCNALEAKGIMAVVVENVGGIAAVTEFAKGVIWVNKENLDAAKAIIIEQIEHVEHVVSGETWSCVSCGEVIEAQFGSCWSCGGLRVDSEKTESECASSDQDSEQKLFESESQTRAQRRKRYENIARFQVFATACSFIVFIVSWVAISVATERKSDTWISNVSVIVSAAIAGGFWFLLKMIRRSFYQKDKNVE